MALATWVDGNQLGATDLNLRTVQVHLISKPSDETVTNTETMQNDDHLKFPALANTTYLIKLFLIVNGADVNGGIEMGFYGPANSEFYWCSDMFGDSGDYGGDVSRTRQQMANLPNMETNGTDADLAAPAMGILVMGDTSGTFGLRWTQGTANATATRVKALSCMFITKLG